MENHTVSDMESWNLRFQYESLWSGIPRTFWTSSVISMSYDITFHMTGIYIYTWYTTDLIFPNKLIFLSCQMDICILSVPPISTRNLVSHGNYFSRLIWYLRKVWYMTGIFHDLYGYIPRLLCVSFHCGLVQIKPWNCHHKSDLVCTDASIGGGQHAIPSQAYLTEQSCMTGVYTR
jgi:hypothetical protein